MGRKALFVEVTVFDSESGEVEKKTVTYYDGTYGYEVKAMFESLGEAAAKAIDRLPPPWRRRHRPV